MIKKEGGVSPVIGVILMVAISVVLAATIYVLVAGGMLSSTPATNQLIMTLKFDSRTSTHNLLNFSIISTSPESTFKSNVKITLVISNTTTVLLTYNASLDRWTNGTPSSKWHYVAKLIDTNADGKFSNGDVLSVYTVDDNPADSIVPPPFHTGDRVVVSVVGFTGVSTDGYVVF